MLQLPCVAYVLQCVGACEGFNQQGVREEIEKITAGSIERKIKTFYMNTLVSFMFYRVTVPTHFICKRGN